MSMPDEPRTATLRDVAEEAGVSISTASRALTGSRPVSATLSRRVTEAAERLGYRANLGARSLRLSRTMTIGLAAERMDAPVYLDILQGLTSAAAERGYAVLLAAAGAGGDVEGQREQLRRLYERRVDGVLVAGLRAALLPELEPFVRAGVPALGLFGRERECRDFPVLIMPQEEVFDEVMGRLSELGHRRVIYIDNHAALASRWRPMSKTSERHGITAVQHLLASGLSMEEQCEELARILRADRAATTIFVHGRHLGALVWALRELGESIPEDRSVIQFVDSWSTRGLMETPISAIHVDTEALGREAVSILDAWIGGEEPPNICNADLSEWRETGSVGPARMG